MDGFDISDYPYLLALAPTLFALAFYLRGRRFGRQIGSMRIYNVVKRAARAGRASMPGPVVDALPVMLSCQDLEGRYLFLNARQALAFGTPPENAIGLNPSELLGKRRDAKAAAVEREVLKSGEPAAPFEETFTDSNGRVHRWLTLKVPVKNESGRVMYLATLSQDMDGGQLMAAPAANGGASAGEAEEQVRAMLESARQREELAARKLAEAETRQRAADEALRRARDAEARAKQAHSNADASASHADSEQAQRLAEAERQLTQARLDLERAEARLKQGEQESLRTVNEAERRARQLLEDAQRRQMEADQALAAVGSREAEALSRAKELERQAEAAMARANELAVQAAEAGRSSEASGEHRVAKMLTQAREEADRYVNEARQKSEEILANARRQADDQVRKAGDSQQSQLEFERTRERIRDLERQAAEAIQRANAKSADSDALMRRATSFEEEARRNAQSVQKQAEELLIQARQRELQIDAVTRDIRLREEQVEAAFREVRERESKVHPSRAEAEAERIIARAKEREAQAEQALAYARQKSDELLTMTMERQAVAAGVLAPEPTYLAAGPVPDGGGEWNQDAQATQESYQAPYYSGAPAEAPKRRAWLSNFALLVALTMAAILAGALWYRDDLLGKKRPAPSDRRPAKTSAMDPAGMNQALHFPAERNENRPS